MTDALTLTTAQAKMARTLFRTAIRLSDMDARQRQTAHELYALGLAHADHAFDVVGLTFAGRFYAERVLGAAEGR